MTVVNAEIISESRHLIDCLEQTPVSQDAGRLTSTKWKEVGHLSVIIALTTALLPSPVSQNKVSPQKYPGMDYIASRKYPGG